MMLFEHEWVWNEEETVDFLYTWTVLEESTGQERVHTRAVVEVLGTRIHYLTNLQCGQRPHGVHAGVRA